ECTTLQTRSDRGSFDASLSFRHLPDGSPDHLLNCHRHLPLAPKGALAEIPSKPMLVDVEDDVDGGRLLFALPLGNSVDLKLHQILITVGQPPTLQAPGLQASIGQLFCRSDSSVHSS